MLTTKNIPEVLNSGFEIDGTFGMGYEALLEGVDQEVISCSFEHGT